MLLTDEDHPDGMLVSVGPGRKMWIESEGAGTPLLLLSGLGPAGSHAIFHPYFSRAAEHFRVIYVDLVSRGRSDRVDDLDEISFASDVADVAALIKALGFGPVHIYGFSYGGLIGQALALDHANWVRTLTLANSLHSPEMWQLNHENINRILAMQQPETWARIVELHDSGIVSTDPRLADEFARHGPLVRFFNPANADMLASESNARNVALYPIFVGEDVDFRVGGKIVDIPDFRCRLGELEVPTQVIAGAFDRALYPSLQREFVTANSNITFHLLERSGSFAHVEETETVINLLVSITSGSMTA